jgi:hypothetical protein
VRFNNRLHHLTVTLLWEAYERLKQKAAPGVDAVDCRSAQPTYHTADRQMSRILTCLPLAATELSRE